MNSQLLQEIVNGLVLGSTYALVAVGFNVIYGVVGILNVAQGDIAVAGSYVSLAVLAVLGITSSGLLAASIGLLASLVGSAIIGAVLYFGVVKRIPDDQMLSMFVATIGVSLAIEYLIARLEGSYPKTFPSLLGNGSWTVLGVLVTHAEVIVVVVSLLLALVVGLSISKTSFGRKMRAVAEQPEVAAAYGVNVESVRLLSVCGTSMIAGLAGFLLAGLFNTAEPFLGQTLALNMFVVSIVGGSSSVLGAVTASAVLGIASSVAQGYVSANVASMIPLAFLVVFLIVRPEGLFSASQLRRG